MEASAAPASVPRAGPLAGLTVVDLGQIYNGPYATFLMAMAGADVIKIEAKGGEHLRRRSVVGGAALPFAMLNSNKTFATLDLKSEKGRELFLRMAERADVVMENFAPGAMERLGLGYEALMSVTGFADRPPVKAGPALCDFFGGTHLYAGIMTALFERERTGRGRLVEVSMQEAVYASLASNLGLHYGSGGQTPARTGNRHGGPCSRPWRAKTCCPRRALPTSSAASSTWTRSTNWSRASPPSTTSRPCSTS